MVYALTGKYFCIKKMYTYESLAKWAETLGHVTNTKITKHRLSLADNIIKINAQK